MTTAAASTDVARYRLHIGGQWSDGSTGESFDDLDPFTGEVVARAAAGTRDDARRAIDAAAAAFPAWSATPPALRQKPRTLSHTRRLAARTPVRGTL